MLLGRSSLHRMHPQTTVTRTTLTSRPNTVHGSVTHFLLGKSGWLACDIKYAINPLTD